MNRLTLNKPVDEMSMLELAQNCVYVKDRWVRYRDYEEDIDLIDLAIKLSRGLGGNIVTAGNGKKEDIDEELWDNLQYGYTDKDGLVAFIYTTLVGMCNLRERLKMYEDIKDMGQVGESKYTYGKIASFKPIEKHYENKGEPPYIKYSCPICSILGNKHQIIRGDKQCPLCGVNLNWENGNIN